MKQLAIFAALLVCGSARAQTWSPPPASSPNTANNSPVVVAVNPDGSKIGTGTGVSDASAANQATQITAEQAAQATLGAKTDAKSTATDATSISIVQILKEISAMVQAPPSQAITAKQYTGTPSNYTVGTTDATVFTLAAGEIGFIQNLDDAPLAVKKGAGASTSSLSFILPAGTAADDGKGGVTPIDNWVGVVSVAAMAGSPRYIAWKQAP